MRFPESAIPLVGASGAIAGLMGAFVVYFAATRIRFLLIPTPVTVSLPALVVFPLWLVEQMFLSRYGGAESGIAFSAHVGGFVFGLAAAGLARLAWPEEAPAEPGSHAAMAAERQAFEDALSESDTVGIEAVGVRLLERLRTSRGEAEALLFVEEVRERVGLPRPARLWLAAASLLERHDAEGALLMYQEIVEQDAARPASLRALMRRGDLLGRQGKTREARRALEQALEHPACSASFKGAIERSLTKIGR
jgi:hypothetical protein